MPRPPARSRRPSQIEGVVLAFVGGGGLLLERPEGEAVARLRESGMGRALHGDRVRARFERAGAPGLPAARVVTVLTPVEREVVGTVLRERDGLWLEPDDGRLPGRIQIRPGRLALKGGEILAVKLTGWEESLRWPVAEAVEVLGRAGDPWIDQKVLIRRFALPERFPDEAVDEAAIASAAPDPAEGEREDHRGKLLATIDPDDAKDFDDAITVRREGDGWSADVYIADVASFVKPGGTLDAEARRRGNSVYLPGRVIPMLPEVLSNGACSLAPDQDRRAVGVRMFFGPNGELKRAGFGRGMIRSRRRLRYAEALRILHGEGSDEVSAMVREAGRLAAVLRAARMKAGALDLDMAEARVEVDPQGRALRLSREEQDESHQLIEELMLAANRAVAARLLKAARPAIYRVHAAPADNRMEELAAQMESYGVRAGNLHDREGLSRLLAQIRGRPDESMLKLAVLRSLPRAEYATAATGHFGLAVRGYLHFTSPIRRYADLVVHRCLLDRAAPSDAMPALATHLSRRERVAQETEREALRLKQLEWYLAGSGKTLVHRAEILRVERAGARVVLLESGTAGWMPLNAMGGGRPHFDRGKGILRVGKSEYRPGLIIETRVTGEHRGDILLELNG